MSVATIRQSVTAAMTAWRVLQGYRRWRASRRRAAAVARAEALRAALQEWADEFNENEQRRARGRHNYREQR